MIDQTAKTAIVPERPARELLKRGLAATMPPDAGWASSSGHGAIRAEHGSLHDRRH
jgi:hypothetical protein